MGSFGKYQPKGLTLCSYDSLNTPADVFGPPGFLANEGAINVIVCVHFKELPGNPRKQKRGALQKTLEQGLCNKPTNTGNISYYSIVMAVCI